MAKPIFSSGFTVSVDGSPIPEGLMQHLVLGVVDDSLNLPDLVSLRFRDPDRTFLEAAGITVGAQLVVGVSAAGQNATVPLATVEVTTLEAELDSSGSYTTVRALDPAHRLFRGRRTETYTQVTASDVATKIAHRVGLTVGTVEPTSTVYDHLCQGGLSDWGFLDTLAREIGYEVSVRDGRFDFRRPAPAHDAPSPGAPADEVLLLRQGADLIRFRAVVTSADQVRGVEVRGWDVAEKKALVGRHDAATPSAQLEGASPAALAKVFGDATYVSGDVPYRTQAEVDTAAAGLAERIAGSFAELDGVARGNPRIRAGAAIAVDNVGKPFDGKYVVTTSRHVLDPTAGYMTHFGVSGRQDRSLYGLVTNGGTGGPGPGGLALALVTDVKDPQARGRVRLSFPWLSDDHVSGWARTVHAGAGHERGVFVLPEVGDEVLVGFEQGDLHQPYVLGGLYNGKDAPPPGSDPVDPGTGTVSRWSVRTRSGHRLELLDSTSDAGLRATSGDDKLVLTLDAAKTALTLRSDGTVEVSGTRGVTVDAGSGDLKLTGGNVTIQATNAVTVEGPQVTVSASAAATLDGGASTTVKGGMVRIN